VLWVESARALVLGDSLVERGDGLELPRDWLSKDASPDAVLAGLRPLLDLPVEHVLPTHGQPAGRGMLQGALA
jgi:glyoxylase-like metal-dependent hydrolase (beta-lactamase superfamily II)